MQGPRLRGDTCWFREKTYPLNPFPCCPGRTTGSGGTESTGWILRTPQRPARGERCGGGRAGGAETSSAERLGCDILVKHPFFRSPPFRRPFLEGTALEPLVFYNTSKVKMVKR